MTAPGPQAAAQAAGRLPGGIYLRRRAGGDPAVTQKGAQAAPEATSVRRPEQPRQAGS